MPASLDPALLDRLPPELRGAVAAALEAERAARRRAEERVARLEHLIGELRRARFGRSSEKLGGDQLELAFEDIETAIAEEREARGSDEARASSSARAPRRRSRALPKGLPREERVIAPADLACPCGCGQMVVIGEGEPWCRHRFETHGERRAARRRPGALPRPRHRPAPPRMPQGTRRREAG